MKTLRLLPFISILLIVSSLRLWSQCATGLVNMNYWVATAGSGTYADPATGSIEYGFCFTLNSYYEKATNWVHGIYVNWGDIPPGVTITKGLTGEQPAQYGSRYWIWIDSLTARQLDLPGLGYYVDDGDGNPKTNYGDNGIGTPNATFPDLDPFCFKANYTCGAPTLLRPVVTVSGDGTTGAWKNPSCPGDVFKATLGGPENDGILIVCGLVLPLELLTFEGDALEGSNYIYWSGIADNKFSHYELEKRTEASNGFRNLQNLTIPIDVKENNIHFLSFKDINVDQEVSYYRLKMVEQDQTFSYSRTIALKKFSVSKNQFNKVYPNPVDDLLFVDLQSSTTVKTYRIEIQNMDGSIITSKEIKVKGPASKESIDCSQLHAGVYFIKISTDNENAEVFKLFKR